MIAPTRRHSCTNLLQVLNVVAPVEEAPLRRMLTVNEAPLILDRLPNPFCGLWQAVALVFTHLIRLLGPPAFLQQARK